MSRNSQRGYDQSHRGQGGYGGRGWTPAAGQGGFGSGSNVHNPYEIHMRPMLRINRHPGGQARRSHRVTVPIIVAGLRDHEQCGQFDQRHDRV